MARPKRFTLTGPDGDDVELHPSLSEPGAVLSRALTAATSGPNPEASQVWTVMEWEDVLYRVHRFPHPRGLDVRVETCR